ncbi:flavodoxin family protein [Streptomyces sp. NPDC057654]|uniref:flavodoxin family protein n=1 Tax=Streptomyces sp. NPDC057654 TaxID=3346196 RepID=UPI0036B6BF7C
MAKGVVMVKAVIVCVSVSHGNTRRVADSMAEVLGAKVVTPEEADLGELGEADVVGFGSGVFYGRLHPRLTGFVKGLPGPSATRWGRAFVFATSGLPGLPLVPFARPLGRVLESKGFEVAGSGEGEGEGEVAGSFSCRGYDTWAPFKLVGGINRRRPNAGDLAAAREFAGRVGGGDA